MSRRVRGIVVGGLVVSLAAAGGIMALASTGGGEPGSAAGAMPTADLDGWDLVFTDDFERDELGDGWSTYSGQPGGDPHSWWDPAHVELRDGNLVLAGYERGGRWTTGGVSNWPVLTYGKWEVRFRADASDEITYHFLLWPQRDAWPPEIDFLEDFGGPRQGAAAFVHHVGDDGQRGKVEKNLADVDFTQWHTAGVEWTPGRVDLLVDGEVWDSVTGEVVPDEPMWMALQAQAGGCARSAEWGFPRCPQAGVPERADVEIDWAAVWEWTG